MSKWPDWVAFYLIHFHKLLIPIRESVTGVNKLLEEFISVTLALLNVKQFNLTAFPLRGRKMMSKGKYLPRGPNCETQELTEQARNRLPKESA